MEEQRSSLSEIYYCGTKLQSFMSAAMGKVRQARTFPCRSTNVGLCLDTHFLTNLDCYWQRKEFYRIVKRIMYLFSVLMLHHIINLPFHKLTCQFQTCQFVNLPVCKLAILSTYNFITLPFCKLAILSTCHFVDLSFCKLAILATCHFGNLPFCQLATLSTCHFVNLPFCQLAIL